MELSPIHPSPCLHVFTIPELADLICSNVSKHDLSSLVRVCRPLLQEICPILWRDVHGSGVYTLVRIFCGDNNLPNLKDGTPPNDISRFAFYAPLIQSLDLPVDAPEELKGLEHWTDFLECARSTTLLPNLEMVRITRPEELMGQPSSPDVIRWITTFLSPLLKSIRFLPGKLTAGDMNDLFYQCIELGRAHELLLEMSERCPLLEVIGIFPSGIPPRTASEPLFPLNSQFNCLRELVTNGFVLDPQTLLTLARFPRLESLTIHGHCQDCAVYCKDLVFPDDSFRALRFLDIRHLSLGTLFNIMNLPLLCRNLEALHIQLLYCRRPWRAHNPHIYQHIISSLANHQPPIRTLSIRGWPGQRISSRMMFSLKQLPLSTLQIWDLIYTNTRLKRFCKALPAVQELDILADSPFSPRDLRLMMANLPKLRLLNLNLRPAGDREYDPAPSPVSSTDDFLLESNIYLEPRRRESAEEVARFLYALNPNVRYGPKVRSPPFAEPACPGDENEDVDMINQALAQLRMGNGGLAT